MLLVVVAVSCSLRTLSHCRCPTCPRKGQLGGGMTLWVSALGVRECRSLEGGIVSKGWFDDILDWIGLEDDGCD